MVKYVGLDPQREYCKRFGQIAVEMGFVTSEQLKVALMEQVDEDLAGRPHRYLGSVFIGKDWMTEKQVEAVLYKMFGVTREETPSVTTSPGEK